MAYALIANGEGFSTDGQTNAVTGSLDTTGANLLVAVIAEFEPGTDPVCTMQDSKSNSWTGLTTQFDNSGARVTIYYSVPTSVGSGHTFTSNQGGVFLYSCVFVSAWSGAAASSPFDQQNGAHDVTETLTTLATGSVTPSEDSELVIAGCAQSNAGSNHSINGGFTISNAENHSGGVHIAGGMAYLVQTTATAANPSWSWTSAARVAVAIATFKAAAVVAAASQGSYDQVIFRRPWR